MINRLKKIFPLLTLLLSGCGYHWNGSDSEKAISIPYVSGDEEGSFSSELIRAFAQQGAYVRDNGRYRLEVSIVQTQNQTISYRVDPQKIDGKVRKEIIADQNRKIVSADVSLFEKEKVIFGPHRITASADYDYYDGDSYEDLSFEYEGKRLTALAFSLGQLESSETAQEAAAKPLYTNLSQKIADLIISKL